MIVEYLKHQGITVVHLNLMRLDAENAEETLEQLKFTLNKTEHLIIDLSSMEYMDSSGLGVLLNCYREQKAEGNEIFIVAVTPMVKTLFDLVYMEKIIKVFGDLKTAIRSTKNYSVEDATKII
ncbi:MAG: STAS domain-containing protein [Lentisphaerales bacterium]|nr:STAS domain-containing protein [Lentisphaerales bacterium]